MYISKKFEDLTIRDDFMFGIIMRDPRYCRPLKRLLNFIEGRQPEDAFTQDLSEAVESAKRNEKWRLDYMTLQMAYDEKYREGRKNGIVEEKEDTARRMLASSKYSDAEISEITGLSMEQIQHLKESL